VKVRTSSWFIPALAAGMAWAAFAQTPAARPARGAAPGPGAPAVATVGALRISRSEFEKRFEQGLRDYKTRTGAELPKDFRPMVRRQLLETAVRQRLLMLEAERRGVLASYEEAEAELKKDPTFQTNGAFNEPKYIAIRSGQPQAFQAAIEDLRRTLPASRLAQALEREHQPSEAEVRARVARRLRRFEVDYLPLRRSDFDGGYREPREADVLAYYRAHAGEFRRGEEARVSVVFVNQPELPDSLAADDDARRRWDQRMARTADSLLAALRGGATLEGVADPFGGVKSAVLERDRQPSWWRGGGRDLQAVFAAAGGTVLRDAIPAEQGRAIVRVDVRSPAGPAPLRQVAVTIRAQLRERARMERDQVALRGFYETLRDSLRGPAWRIRYAILDTAALRTPEPSAADLDRYYRGHLADYSSFDAVSGTVVARSQAEVRDDLRRRWIQEQRATLARSAARGIEEAWRRGRRDAAAERAALVRDVGPVPGGGAVDSGQAGAALTDSLTTGMQEGQVGTIRFGGGLVVYHVHARVADYVPTFEQARPILTQRLAPRRDAQDEAGARRLYDADPTAFRTGDVLHFTRLLIEPVSVFAVRLDRADVESYYQRSLDKYSADELVRVRHLLVSPAGSGEAADREARSKAEGLLRRIRGGERLADLAREYSDDPATRNQGGDVGVFRHGMMLDEFERVAFRMRPGDISDLVKTEVGYHILECTEYVPMETTPLEYAYSNVAGDLAQERANRATQARAESLFRTLRTPADARRAAARIGAQLMHNEQRIGNRLVASELIPYFEKLETVKPGQLYPGVQEYRGLGWVITWVDSLAPPKVPTWEQARAIALDRYRRDSGRRALLAKRAELDSLAAAGWSLDSLGALFGGLEHYQRTGPGGALPRLSGKTQLDSLVLGTGKKDAVLDVGQDSGWVEFVNGFARVRLLSRREPDPVQLAGRVESERRLELERKLQTVFDRLKQRFTVRILDRELRATPLPPLPEPS
jgi:parvulin-like peptidyl-prolyl isomerase